MYRYAIIPTDRISKVYCAKACFLQTFRHKEIRQSDISAESKRTDNQQVGLKYCLKGYTCMVGR